MMILPHKRHYLQCNSTKLLNYSGFYDIVRCATMWARQGAWALRPTVMSGLSINLCSEEQHSSRWSRDSFANRMLPSRIASSTSVPEQDSACEYDRPAPHFLQRLGSFKSFLEIHSIILLLRARGRLSILLIIR